MEELALSLLENQIAGYEPTINRFGYQTKKHLQKLMSEITLLRLQKIESPKNKNALTPACALHNASVILPLYN
jgi:hypothetical protein